MKCSGAIFFLNIYIYHSSHFCLFICLISLFIYLSSSSSSCFVCLFVYIFNIFFEIGETAFHLARGEGHATISGLLVKNGAEETMSPKNSKKKKTKQRSCSVQ